MGVKSTPQRTMEPRVSVRQASSMPRSYLVNSSMVISDRAPIITSLLGSPDRAISNTGSGGLRFVVVLLGYT
jgi:hypothetical protein